MKRIIVLFSILLSLSMAVLFFTDKTSYSNELKETKHTKQSSFIPIPTEVNNKMANEEEYEERRDNYLELIHTNGQDIDWRKINEDLFNQKAEWRASMKNSKAVIQYANGEIAGEWFERGSTDQAGNVRVTSFDQQSEAVYAISDGGLLWKGNLTGSSWTSLNDSERLGPEVLETIRMPNGDLRILATKGRRIYYSDDDGDTWTAASGFTGANSGRGMDLFELNDNDSTIIYLYVDVAFTGSATNRLAISTNHGVSFTNILALNSNTTERASLTVPYESSIAYLMDWDDDMYKFENGTLTLIASNLNLSSPNASQIEAVITSTDTIIYALMDNEDLYKSTDAGLSFNSVGQLTTSAWNCGIGVSIDNPDILYYGEVNMYQSNDGGLSWTQVAYWGDYYSDVVNNIHADIMEMKTYKKLDGTEFALTSNHGGISISYDGLVSNLNIGLLDLNVGQMYDVATSPINSAFIYGGTQDQGLQRSSLGLSTGPVSFEQVISGDYGEQQFSNYGQSFWTQYPGADFSYYSNANSANWSDYWFDIEGTDMPSANWIVPTGSAPNPEDDYILVGGGSADGGAGSYLIKLENTGGTANATNFPFDFKDASGQEIGAIETTPYNDQKWYVACENGDFFHSEDAGMTWTESTTNLGPSSSWIWSADVYASRLTADLVFLGGTSYSGSNVYTSSDGGITFTPMANGMPQTMVHEMCMDSEEKFLFAATDAGPYMYSVMQDQWFDLGGLDAPLQNYTSCEFVASENTVRFATYGRGIWDFKIADLVSVDEVSLEGDFSIYPTPASNGMINIQVEEYSQIKIIDLNGRVVAQTALLKGVNPIDLSFLQAGMYLVVGTDAHGRILKEKIVID